jgi:hypothetical protein
MYIQSGPLHYRKINVLNRGLANHSCTPACSAALAAHITSAPLWVEEILAFDCWSVDPRKQVLEDGPWVVKVLRPAAPSTHIPDGPTQYHDKILTTSPSERVSAVRAGIDPNVQQIATKALHEGVL